MYCNINHEIVVQKVQHFLYKVNWQLKDTGGPRFLLEKCSWKVLFLIQNLQKSVNNQGTNQQIESFVYKMKPKRIKTVCIPIDLRWILTDKHKLNFDFND